jgi:hypothetical protein
MKHFEKYIDEAINLELNVAELYTVFCKAFPKDFDFWWKLSEEENNHAALLRSLKRIGPVIGEIPGEIFPHKLEELIAANTSICAIIKKFKKNPSRKEAFNIALEIEKSAGEMHFQTFMKRDSLPEDYDVFQKLNNDDIDHAARIQQYMTEHNI